MIPLLLAHARALRRCACRHGLGARISEVAGKVKLLFATKRRPASRSDKDYPEAARGKHTVSFRVIGKEG